MPFPRPTLEELDARTASNVASRLGDQARPSVRSNVLALTRAQAALVNGLYEYIEWVAKQTLPDTADDEEAIFRHGSIRGLQLKPATKAQGYVVLTGTDGAVAHEGTYLQAPDGRQYVLKEEVTISGGTATALAEAVERGNAGNITSGELSLVSPEANIDSAVQLSAEGLTGGVNEERLKELKARVLKLWRQPIQGGARHDYEQWAREIPGVTRVWVTQELGEGTVTVRYVLDNEADIFPTDTHLQTVQNHLETKKPVTAHVFAASPVKLPHDFTVQLSPNTEAVRLAVTAEINDLLSREAEPGKTILLSKIREAVSIAVGEHDHILTSPTANLPHGKGEMAVPGLITFMEIS
jgi:uncharacterized phage protein gp47/JayE